MIASLMMPAELDTLDIFEINIFWNKSYGIIISVHVVTNEILWRDSNYVLDVDNSAILL